MKNIKILLFAFSTMFLASCGDDDYSIAYQDNEAKTGVTGTITLGRTSAAPTTMLDFSFTLSQSFSKAAKVEVTATTFDFNTSKVFVNVAAGQTSGSGSIEMPGEGTTSNSFFGINEFASVTLTGIALVDSEGTPTTDPYTLNSEAALVKLIDYNGDYMSPRDDAMKILMDWAAPWDVNDLDMYVFNATTFDQVETAESGSRYEGDWFNDFHPDGDYFVAVGFFTVEGGDLPYTFHFTHPDGSVDYYEGVFPDSENLSFEFPIINITKTTDADGVSTYTTSLP